MKTTSGLDYLTLRHQQSSLRIQCLFVLLCCAATIHGASVSAQGSVSHGRVTFQFTASPEADNNASLIFDGRQSLGQLNLFYFDENELIEKRMPVPSAQSYSGNGVVISWDGVGGWDVKLIGSVFDCLMSCTVPGDYGQIELSYELTNNSGFADDFALYLYIDWAIAGQSSDSAQLVEGPANTRLVRVFDVASFDVLVEQPNSVVGGLFGLYAVEDASSLLARLDDAVFDTYENTGLPYILGDLATVWQPVGFLVAPASTTAIPALTVKLGYSIFFDGFESGDLGAWSSSP